jgi:hypothetical protein
VTEPVPDPPGWREQYERMCRWRDRLAAASVVDARLVDEFYAFCVFCYHLKDWLQNDAAVSARSKGEVVKYVNGNLRLRLCADLANGAKHLVLDDRRRFDTSHRPETTLVLDLGFGISMFPVKPALTIPLPAGDQEERVSALGFAESCVGAWDEFLKASLLL